MFKKSVYFKHEVFQGINTPNTCRQQQQSRQLRYKMLLNLRSIGTSLLISQELRQPFPKQLK